MIDTLHIQMPTERLEIANNAWFKLKPPAVDMRTGEVDRVVPLYRPEGEEWVLGQGAYHNNEDNSICLTVNGYGCGLNLSLPRRHSGELNYHPVPSLADAVAVVQKAEAYLEEQGIKGNWLEGNVSRLDLFRNLSLSLPTHYYLETLGKLADGRLSRQEWGGQGVLFKNTRRQICCYNKVEEVESKHPEVDWSKVRPGGDNILRIESRYLKGEKVEEVFRTRRVRSVLGKWYNLPKIYEKELRGSVFRKRTLHHLPSLRSDMRTLERVSKMYEGRNCKQKTKDALLYLTYAQKGYTPEAFALLMSSQFDERTVRRWTREYEQVYLSWTKIQDEENKRKRVSAPELYEELYNELFRKVA